MSKSNNLLYVLTLIVILMLVIIHLCIDHHITYNRIFSTASLTDSQTRLIEYLILKIIPHIALK